MRTSGNSRATFPMASGGGSPRSGSSLPQGPVPLRFPAGNGLPFTRIFSPECLRKILWKPVRFSPTIPRKPCTSRNRNAEASRQPDPYQHTILVRHLSRLLGYTLRFYERQFITRSPQAAPLLAQYRSYLREWILQGNWGAQGPLSVQRCAHRFHLSPAYLEDLLRFETGYGHLSHLERQRLDIAKEKLSHPHASLARIAAELGFSSPQGFQVFFRKTTGLSPRQYALRIH